MSHTPHDLAEDFPELAERIHDLRQSDAHFARLAEEYAAVNERVYAAETTVRPMSPDAETELRKKRAALKDEIYRLLVAAEA